MRILGIDPGIAAVGFGIVESEKNTQRLISCGVVSTPAGLSLSVRLGSIYDDICELIRTYSPDSMAVEALFFNTNLKTGISVAHGRGVILLAGFKSGVDIAEYTPLQVKQAVAGYGRADKKQVMEMTKRILKLKSSPRPDDAADAVAIALCHARSATSLLNAERRGSACSTT